MSKIVLSNALVQPDAGKMARKLLSSLFSLPELVNGNIRGETTSKDLTRLRTIQRLDPLRVKYIRGTN